MVYCSCPGHYYPPCHVNCCATTNLRLCSSSSSTFQLSYSAHHQNPTSNEPPHPTLRTHNSKSTSFVLHHLSHTHQQPNKRYPQPPEQLTEPASTLTTIPPEEKAKLLQLSLVTKRTPQFPGSIYAQSPSDLDVTSSLPPLQTLFTPRREDGEEHADDQETILKALEIRRKVTKEIFKDAMTRKGKFGITYSTNLVNMLGDFIDHVMIEAAALKRLPEFSESTFNVRARTVIHDSNVVPLIRWLKHNDLSYPKIGKLICSTRGNLDSIRRLVEWLKSIHVKGEFLGVVLTRSGDNILERSDAELDELVEYLESTGVRRDWMGFVMSRCPELLCFSMEEVKTRVEFYMDMGMNEKDFGTMVFDCPKVLGFFTLEDMSQKVHYLKEFGLTTEEVGRLLAFKPQLMCCSIEKKWEPLLKYLYYLGISRDGMRRMLTIKPMVFCVDLETTIVPKVRFFQDIGIPDDAIGNMLAKFPPLLTYSLYKKIRPVVVFLMTKAGVSERDIGKVIALGPELLGCSIAKKLEVNVKYFLSLGIRLQQLGEMIADFPMLLRYNTDILRAKYRYLRRTMVRTLEDLTEFPRFFSYSLDGRIIPRHRIMVENRVNFKLRYMLACTNDEFKKRVEDKVERRCRFEAGTTTVHDDLTNSYEADDDPMGSNEMVDFSENEDSFCD
ncbi:transcription termination factor MTERF2, chloroplastic isoform X2 [Carica papaya]|uniref:transcription termination factor MTERF2, chloroplastic isoform X2 n=1 Tax=Carica papaya TaxID=3649 RepID=UPI000B8CF32F|nr:transcription termination factor MTERF2, chloroplastic isoform X2 [Carica papaya]